MEPRHPRRAWGILTNPCMRFSANKILRELGSMIEMLNRKSANRQAFPDHVDIIAKCGIVICRIDGV